MENHELVVYILKKKKKNVELYMNIVCFYYIIKCV